MRPEIPKDFFNLKDLNPFKDFNFYERQKIGSDFFVAKKEIEKLLEKLKKIKNKDEFLRLETDETAGKGNGLIDHCDRIINQQYLSQEPWSKLAMISAFAIKMEIYGQLTKMAEKETDVEEKKRLDRTSQIRQNYKSFTKAARLPAQLGEAKKYKKFSFDNRVKEIDLALIPHLEKIVKVKDGTAPTSMSVPDLLLAASYSMNSKEEMNVAKMRKIFHELWEVESLKPMLTIAAYATQKDVVRNATTKKPYQFKVVIGDKLHSNFSKQNLMGEASKDNIYVKRDSYQGMNPNSISDYEMKGTVVHELHHCWEGLRYDSEEASLPYKIPQAEKKKQEEEEEKLKLPEPTIVQQSYNYISSPFKKFYKYIFPAKRIESVVPEDPNREVKERLNKMLAEAKAISKDHSIEMTEGLYKSFQPFAVFDRLNSYDKNDKTQHAEIVVRVSNALGNMVAEGRTEEQAFEIMRASGLNECVDFFLEERQQMREVAGQLQAGTGMNFAKARKFYEIPQYFEYKSSDLHDAVREGNSELIAKILADESTEIANDSFGQNALELAFDIGSQPEVILELYRSPEMQDLVKENPPLMKKAVMYLVNLAKDETSSDQAAALNLFREVKRQNQDSSLPFIAQIFNEAKNLTLDRNLAETIESQNADKTLEMIESGAIPFRDKFGNTFSEYVFYSDFGKFRRELIAKLDKGAQERIDAAKMGSMKFMEAIARGEKPLQEELGEHFETYAKLMEKSEHAYDLAWKVGRKYDLNYLQTNDQFLPTNPLRCSLSNSDAEMFLKAIRNKNPETTLEMLCEETGLLKENYSAIEMVAHICSEMNLRHGSNAEQNLHLKEQQSKWFEAFKEMVQMHKIDIDKEFGNSGKSVSKLLPFNLREAADLVSKKSINGEIVTEIPQEIVRGISPLASAKHSSSSRLQGQVAMVPGLKIN